MPALLHLFRTLLRLLPSVLILGLAFWLRTRGGNWDQGLLLHPDERFLCMVTEAMRMPDSPGEYFHTEASPLNPHNLDKGRFVYGTLPVFLTQFARARAEVTDLAQIAAIGRSHAALWSTGAVLVLLLFAARLGGPGFANLMALWMACTVLAIQHAHFHTVDSAGLFFSILITALGTLAVKEHRPLLLLPATALTGLAMACRLNLGLLGLWLLLAALALACKQKSLSALFTWALGALAAALLFRIAQPYAFAATGFWPAGLNPRWVEDLKIEYAITTGVYEVPYILQWVNRLPGLYPLHQALARGLGWPLGLLSLTGTLALLWTLRHQPAHWLVILLLWPVLLFGYHSRFFLQTMRYFLPAYPVLILGGGLALRRLPSRPLRSGIALLTTLATAAYAFAFLDIYRHDHTRIQASAWLLDALPDGGGLTYEIWDDPLPLRLSGRGHEHARIHFHGLPVYDPDTPEKLEQLIDTIAKSDFVVLSSTRVSHSIPRLPLRYPLMTRFYRLLDSGELGLREAVRFERTPAFGPLRLSSLRAEEVFRVYDHPLVRIYEKTESWNPDTFRETLGRGIPFDRIPDIRYRDGGRWNNGLLSEAGWDRRKGAPRFAQRFHPDSIGNRSPLLVWVLMLLFMGVVTLPVSVLLFPSLADRGFFTRRLLGLLMISYLSWLPASLGLLAFEHSLSLAFGGLCLLNGILFATHQERILLTLRRHWKTLAFGEAVWWSVFAVFLLLRWFQPELWHPWSGGEKPMDFAFLNATVQSRYFPPVQPWLSGAFLNYYYYGFVLVAVLIRLTGISPDFAYNLALPTFAAFTAGALLSLAATLTVLFRVRPGCRGRKRSALLAVLFTLGLGNLAQLRWFLFERGGHLRDAYWNASRALRVPEGATEPITEFPFFSFLYGDLHAHLLALPVAMLTLIASWQLLRRFHPLRLLTAALLLGGLRLINAWDFPVQAAVLLFALFFPVLRAATPAERLRALRAALGWSLLALLLSTLLYAPFHHHTLSYPARFLLWNGPRSRPVDLLLHHGIFLMPVLLCAPALLCDPRLRAAPSLYRLFPLLLLLGCILLILLLEFFTLDGDIGRMNTVFKFYYQIWWILAVLCALVVRATLQTLRHPFAAGLSIVLLSLGLAYPLTAIPAKLRDRPWHQAPNGLDGLAYLRTAVWDTPEGRPVPLHDDLRVIRWLRENAAPLDILLEAHRPEYQWGGRISWHTGQPALLGWNWHMRQQRPRPGADTLVWQRAADVARLYTTPDESERARLLSLHRIRYVICGELERLTYGEATQELLESSPRLRPVFRYGGAVIFEHRDPEVR